MGYEKNDALTENIWSSLVQGKEHNAENVIEQDKLENATISLVHTCFLNYADLDNRKSDQLSEKVNRRVREEKNLTMQDNKNMHQNWHKIISSTDLVFTVEDAYSPDRIVLSESESESDYELLPLTLRRHMKLASRGSRKSMFALIGKKLE